MKCADCDRTQGRACLRCTNATRRVLNLAPIPDDLEQADESPTSPKAAERWAKWSERVLAAFTLFCIGVLVWRRRRVRLNFFHPPTPRRKAWP